MQMHEPQKVGRRSYLKYGGVGILAAGIAGAAHLLQKPEMPTGHSAQLTNVPSSGTKPLSTETHTSPQRKTTLITEGGKSLVSVVKGGSSTDIEAMVRRAVESIGGIQTIVSAGEAVVVKPPVFASDKNCAPDVRVVLAVVKMVQEAGGIPVVAESSGSGNTAFNLAKVGVTEAAEKVGVAVRDLQTEREVNIPVPNGLALHEVKTYPTILNRDALISVPRLKRHSSATVTISLKNMMGTIPKREMGRFHSVNLSQCIADLNTVIRPDLTVVDATYAMTRTGPTGGDMIEMDAIIASEDPVAADRIAAQKLQELEESIGLSPSRLFKAADVKHINAAAELGVGTNNPADMQIIEKLLS